MKSGRRPRGKTRIVTGLNVVRAGRKDGLDRWYVYAWKGGPCIHRCIGARPVIDMAMLARAEEARRTISGAAHRDTLEELITTYRAAPEFNSLRESTKRDYRLWLNRISQEWGTAPLGAFEDRRMRGDILEWRNRWASQPRTADKAVVMLGTLLAHGVECGRLAINVAAGIRHLHSADRSDQIWERRHMRAFARAPKHLRNALLLAGLTGLRLGDLVHVEWGNVGKTAIVWTTAKRGKRAVIPLLPETRALLDRIGKTAAKKEGPILRNSRGEPWTESGLGTVFQRTKPKGFDRRIHDLRGTFATRLIMAGLTDDQAAMIMGWSAKRIAEIRARYVNEERVVIELAARLSA